MAHPTTVLKGKINFDIIINQIYNYRLTLHFQFNTVDKILRKIVSSSSSI